MRQLYTLKGNIIFFLARDPDGAVVWRIEAVGAEIVYVGIVVVAEFSLHA